MISSTPAIIKQCKVNKIFSMAQTLSFILPSKNTRERDYSVFF